MKVRTWDNVKVISWKDKGKTWKILKVNKEDSRVIVEWVNIVTKHVKGYGNVPGQIVKIERAIDVSNVMIVCPDTKKPTRIGFKIENGKKTRVSKKSWKNI